jgi:hypothetical protein
MRRMRKRKRKKMKRKAKTRRRRRKRTRKAFLDSSRCHRLPGITELPCDGDRAKRTK